MKQILIVIGLMLVMEGASGQPLDSIGFRKAKIQSGKYTLNRFGIAKIKLETKGPTAVTDDGIGTGEKVVEGLFTMFTGWTTSSSSESLWQLNNSVKLSGLKKEIAFPVQVTGFYEKTRERVRDENGSSLETYETYNLYWDEGAKGSILENKDTLGQFALRPTQMVYDSIDYWKSFTGQIPDWLEERLDQNRYDEWSGDFIIDISMDDQLYTLVYNAENFRTAVIRNHEMIGLWQDSPPRGIFTSGKRKIIPYILMPGGLSEQESVQTIILLMLGLSVGKCL